MNDVNTGAQKKGYNHVEAFCLMRYQDKVTKEIKVIWNSRDGVTPFGVTSKDGNESFHVEWEQDRCVPDHVPEVGSNIFIDLTRKKYLEYQREVVERYWEDDENSIQSSPQYKGMTKEEVAILFTANGWQEGMPDTVEVTPEMHAEFKESEALRKAKLSPFWKNPRRA